MATSPTAPTPSLFNLPEGLTPDSVDTIPVVSSLLSRLQNPSLSSTSTSISNAGSPPASSPSQLVSGTGPLSVKEIPAATDQLKHKLQKARFQIRELPDMQRTVEEQEQEIADLKDRIRRQREVLLGLKDIGEVARREREQKERDASADMMEA